MKLSIDWAKKRARFIAESDEEKERLLAIWEQEGIILDCLETKPIYALVCKLGDGTLS